MLRRIGDECLYLVLVFAAKRTSEDFNDLAALAQHDPSMARARWKSRSAKVQRGAAHRAKALRLNRASKDAAAGNQKMACLRATFLAKLNRRLEGQRRPRVKAENIGPIKNAGLLALHGFPVA